MMTSPSTHSPIRRSAANAVAFCALLLTPLTAHAAATLLLSSASPPQGQTGKICVSMTGGAGQIAGLQANMRWDDNCMTPNDAKRLCKANAATGKSVQSALQGRGMLKAILISFSDVNPIPDGELFCCEFLMVGEGRCAAVQLDNIIGSTATGQRINGITAGNTGTFGVGAVAGGPGPDSGAGQQPAPVAQGGQPGAVADTGSAPAAQAPLGGQAPAAAAAPAGRAGAPAAGVPGMPAQAPVAGAGQPAPQYGTDIREPGIQPPDVVAQAGQLETPGAAAGATTLAGTPTPAPATATQAVPPTATKKPDTPTPIPPTNSPTPESGWMGGCEMRIPQYVNN